MKCFQLIKKTLLLFIFISSVVHADDGVTRQRDIIYGRKDGLALTMDVFTPPKARGIGVIWVISGSGRSSVENIDKPSYQTCFKILLGRGYTIFAVIHSSAPRFSLQDMAADVRRAVRFVRYQAGKFEIDADRLGITGASAGGMLALLMGTTGQTEDPNQVDPVERMSSRVQAVGCFFGPSDWLDFDGRGTDILTFQKNKYGFIDPSFIFWEMDSNQKAYRQITDEQQYLILLKELSPLAQVTPDDAPTLLVHGDKDPFIPVQQAQRMAIVLEQVQVENRLVIREGKGHGWKQWEQDVSLLTDWFDEHLKQ